jgi:HEAT repeat protein
MEAKAQATDRLLRAMAAAVKTVALYPGPHPVTQQAVNTLMAALQPYMEAYGPFGLRVGKYALTVDGTPFRGGSHSNLAMHLYTRGVAQIKIMAAASEQGLFGFVSIIGMDRRGLEEAGGVRHLMRQSGIGNIQVAEMALETDEDLQPADLNAIFEWLGRGELEPEDRERILDMLRGGPDATRVFLERAYSMLEGVSESLADDERISEVSQLLRSLDRMMLDEPFEDQDRLYANLAEAQINVREPLRTLLARALLHPDGRDVASRLGEHLTSEQLAHLIHGSVAGGEIAEQVTGFLHALRTDQQKTKAVLAILDSRLRQPQHSAAWLTGAVFPRLDYPARRAEPELPQEFLFISTDTAVADEAAERLRASVALDERDITHEVIRALVDAIAQETGEKELTDLGDALTGHLPWLVQEQEFAALALILERTKRIAMDEIGPRRKTADAILQRMTDTVMLDRLLAALWAARDTLAEKDIRACLKPLADDLVAPLVRVLGMETRGPVRAMVCDLLIELGGGKIDVLGRVVDDQRWYVVRNVANVLGRMHDPRAVAHLGRLVQHPDYRVRRETVMALATIGTDNAQMTLASFFQDPDERIRVRVLQSLDTGHAWTMLPQLLAMLDRRELFERHLELKRAALEVLTRLGARQSLPTLRRLSRRWFAFGRSARELRRLARVAADVIEGHASPQDARLLAGVEIEPD